MYKCIYVYSGRQIIHLRIRKQTYMSVCIRETHKDESTRTRMSALACLCICRAANVSNVLLE